MITWTLRAFMIILLQVALYRDSQSLRMLVLISSMFTPVLNIDGYCSHIPHIHTYTWRFQPQ